MSDVYRVAIDATIFVTVKDGRVTDAVVNYGDPLRDWSSVNDEDIDNDRWNSAAFNAACDAASEYLEDSGEVHL